MDGGALKLIIVDDEHLVRNLLKKCIRWDDYGICLSGEASNSEEALELVDIIQPDLIFTDICMPQMDGIEFSKRVLEKYPQTKIIVLTGHDDFEYAKRSIQIGISDFILKPIDNKEIRKVIISIKKKIEEEKEQRFLFNKFKQQADNSLPIVQEKFLNELIQGFCNQDIENKLSCNNIDLNTEYCQLAVIEYDTIYNTDIISNEGKSTIREKCMAVTTQRFYNEKHVKVFYDNHNRIVIINNSQDIDFLEICKNIRNTIITNLDYFINIGIGSAVDNVYDISASYKEAICALNYKVITGKSDVVIYTQLVSSNWKWQDQAAYSETFSFNLKAGLVAKALEDIDNLYKGIGHLPQAGLDSIRITALNIIFIILNVATQYDININDIFEEARSPYEKVFKLDNLPEIKKMLKEMATKTIESIKSIHNKNDETIIRQIQCYMNNNISSSELSLASLAKKFHINPSYLSRLFKLETGVKFIDYLTKIRIEKAIKLIQETDMKGCKVGEHVGLNDPHYFSICFKKYTGVSLKDYKKSL